MAEKFPDIASMKEVAEMLGVTSQRVHQIIGERDDFPEPIAYLGVGRIWLTAEILQWMRNDGRT